MNNNRQEIDIKSSNRKSAFELFKECPMPMVTITSTFDVTNIVKFSKKYNKKLNALICWCIGNSADKVKEFYYLPDNDKLYKYDKLGIEVVVDVGNNDSRLCDIEYNKNFQAFYKDYLKLTELCKNTKQNYFKREDYMFIGASSVPNIELDSVTNIYIGINSNPYLHWGKIRKKVFKYKLPISFQFHHVQMDGMHAASFMNHLQKEFDSVNSSKI